MATEKLSYEIAAIYSASPEVKRAIDDFAKINTTGAKVRQQLNSMTTVSSKTGEQFRKTRVNTAQLGIQFNQLATQISSGTNVGMAFTQQIGDIGYAMSNAGGKMGAFGRLLSGPVGFAIGGLVMALTPAIEKMFQLGDAADESSQKLEDALQRFNQSLAQQTRLGEVYTAATEERIGLMAEEARLTRQLSAAKERDIGFDSTAAAQRELDIANIEKELAATRRSITAVDNRVEAARSEEALRIRLNRLNASATETINEVSGANNRNAGSIRAVNSALQDSLPTLSAYEEELARIVGVSITPAGFDEARRRLVEDAFDAGMISRRVYIALKDGIGQATSRLRGDEELAARLAEAAPPAEAILPSVEEMQGAVTNVGRIISTEMSQAFENVGNSVSDAFQGMLTGAMSWKDGMKSIIQSVIAELWKLYVVQQIVGVVKGFLGDIGLPMPEGKAVGGYVSQGTPYMVGERGPEMFIPGASGTIIPNHNMGRSGGGTSVTVNVDARGSSDPAMVREQAQRAVLEAAPAIIQAAESRTINRIKRPTLGGVIQ